ncbi:MAG: hypothetical protein QUV06_13905 [Cyanobium sp. CZS 48M]|nr:hypothetical protein [Cyanobium sp. CZS48M]
MSRRSTNPCRTTNPTPGIPLIITALSGSIYGLLVASNVDAFWLLKIHAGNFGMRNLQPYDSAIIGILTLMIALSGVGLMLGGRRK